jgi:hypothetical protein
VTLPPLVFPAASNVIRCKVRHPSPPKKMFMLCFEISRIVQLFVLLPLMTKVYNAKVLRWRHDIQHNDIQHNDIRHDDTQHN